MDKVLQFQRNFYAELVDSTGNGATEVLVGPASGIVWTEYGPAMMWNTKYGIPRGGYGGMMGGYSPGSSSSGHVSFGRAHTPAQNWLSAHRSGVKVETGGDPFPGYYTLETLKDGMISVNARTGAIWLHTWHGAFIAKSE